MYQWTQLKRSSPRDTGCSMKSQWEENVSQNLSRQIIAACLTTVANSSRSQSEQKYIIYTRLTMRKGRGKRVSAIVIRGSGARRTMGKTSTLSMGYMGQTIRKCCDYVLDFFVGKSVCRMISNFPCLPIWNILRVPKIQLSDYLLGMKYGYL